MRGFNPVIFATTALICVAVTGLVFAAGGSNNADADTPSAASQPASRPASQPASQPAVPRVVIETNMGDIVLELHPDKAPKTVDNFLTYVDEGYYKNLLFHRVIKGFMIQGGGFPPGARAPKKPTHPPVVNESEKAGKNVRGTISMARTADVNSATTQFFINTVDNRMLDYPSNGGYTVFGHVVEGMDVVDRIADVRVRRTTVSEAQPVEDVIIRRIGRK